MIHGRYLLSFDERQKALEGFDKAMCKIFRLAESHTSVVSMGPMLTILPYLRRGGGEGGSS